MKVTRRSRDYDITGSGRVAETYEELTNECFSVKLELVKLAELETKINREPSTYNALRYNFLEAYKFHLLQNILFNFCFTLLRIC